MNDLDNQLIDAASDGNIACVQRLIVAGADVHVYNDSPLRSTVYCDNAACVRELVTAGANVHAENDEALRGAVCFERVECVRELCIHATFTSLSIFSIIEMLVNGRTFNMIPALLTHVHFASYHARKEKEEKMKK